MKEIQAVTKKKNLKRKELVAQDQSLSQDLAQTTQQKETIQTFLSSRTKLLLWKEGQVLWWSVRNMVAQLKNSLLLKTEIFKN